jgi:tetratricopeptide (TPR) repeat protein
MKKQQDKLMADFQRLLESQNFKSDDEVRKFMEGMMGKEIPSFPDECLTAKEKAQDLVFAAYDLPPDKAKINIDTALGLDPDCIEAYEFLASIEDSPYTALAIYEKAISIGRRLFGGKYLKENKGMFWGLHETRPFMRCLHEYAEILYIMGKVRESVNIYEEMLELNPIDNQGVRDPLLLFLIELDDKARFEKYAEMYKKDIMAFPLFNRALFAFKTEGNSPSAGEKLKKAMKANKHVVPMLLAEFEEVDLPDHFGFGDKNEAVVYVSYSYYIWRETKGAIGWLKTYC